MVYVQIFFFLMIMPVCLHFCDRKQQPAIRAQIPNIWEDKVIFAHLGSNKLCADCFRNTIHAVACHVGWGERWVAIAVQRAKTDEINHNSSFKASPESCKPLTGFRVARWLQNQTEILSVHCYLVFLGRLISGALFSAIFSSNWWILTHGEGGAIGKESACQCRRHEFDPWVRKIPWGLQSVGF